MGAGLSNRQGRHVLRAPRVKGPKDSKGPRGSIVIKLPWTSSVFVRHVVQCHSVCSLIRQTYLVQYFYKKLRTVTFVDTDNYDLGRAPETWVPNAPKTLIQP